MADISQGSTFQTSSSSSLVQGQAGATLTQGQPVYYDSATGTYKAFDASNSSKNTLAGLAVEAADSGDQILIVTKDPALVIGATLASGDTVWCSATGLTKTIGDLTTGWKIWIAGVMTSATVLNFNPIAGGVK